MYDFKNTKPATSATYLTPGVYKLKPTNVELGVFKTGTPYLAITFQTEDEIDITEKFSLTKNAISRLQYLHVGFFGKECDKAFKSDEEVLTYFKKCLTTKSFVKNIIVGGEIAVDGNIYANLPYTNFVVEDGDLDLGEFEEGSEEWKKYVKKKAKQTSEVEGKNNGLLNDDDEEQIGKKKETKADAKGTGKKVTKKEESNEEEDSEMPW